jgi:hypothetical protein
MDEIKKNMIPFTATIQEDKLPDIQQIATALGNAGIEVQSVLPIIGIITGNTDDIKKVEALKHLGILGVEEQRGFSIM